MAKATYKRGEIRTIKHKADGAAIAVDDVVLLIVDEAKSRVGVARQDIADGDTGIVAVSGVFEFEKADSTDEIDAGFAVNIDSDGKVKPGSASETNGVARCCLSMTDSANGDEYLDLDISDPGTGDVT